MRGARHAVVRVVFGVCQAQGLVVVRRDERGRAVRVEVSNLRVNERGHARDFRERQYSVEHARRDRALVVVGDDERVRLAQKFLERGDDALLHGAVNGRAPLAVGAHDQLAMRDDARLQGSRSAHVNYQTLFGVERACLAQLRAHALARAVATHYADDRGERAERTQVRYDVRRAAQVHRLAPDVHYGDGRFRRDARHVAPHELVEHHVAEDDDRFVSHRRDDFKRALCRQ